MGLLCHRLERVKLPPKYCHNELTKRDGSAFPQMLIVRAAAGAAVRCAGWAGRSISHEGGKFKLGWK